MSYQTDRKSFAEKLDQEHHWPTHYLFKFIVPKGKEEEVTKIFPPDEYKIRESSNGNYVSVSAKIYLESSEEVIKIYEEAYKIPGIISL